MNWLWVYADEEFVDTIKIQKFLEQNGYNVSLGRAEDIWSTYCSEVYCASWLTPVFDTDKEMDGELKKIAERVIRNGQIAIVSCAVLIEASAKPNIIDLMKEANKLAISEFDAFCLWDVEREFFKNIKDEYVSVRFLNKDNAIDNICLVKKEKVREMFRDSLYRVEDIKRYEAFSVYTER